ncbi:hypothetical protein JCM6882_002373 [Rhodosporidiobolus microsporus]
MDDYLTSTKPLTGRSASVKPAAGRPNPYSSLQSATTELVKKGDTSLAGGIERVNRAIVKTLGKEDNPVTNSTAYSRTLHVASCAIGHQSGGGPSGRKWTLHRNGKLNIQKKQAESEVLKGVVAYISGYTGKDITNTQLKELVERQGGRVKTMPGPGITHIFVLDHLSGSKTQQILDANKKSKVKKLVLPEWAVECARRGKRISEARFMAPVFSEVQQSTYTIFSGASGPSRERDSRPPSDASTSSSSSSARSPPLTSTSSSTSFVSAPHVPGAATASLLAHLDAGRTRKTVASRTADGKRKAKEEEGDEGVRKKAKGKAEEEEVIVLGSSDVEVEGCEGADGVEGQGKEGEEETPPPHFSKNTAWAGLAGVGYGGETDDDDDDGLDGWGMPPSGQGR